MLKIITILLLFKFLLSTSSFASDQINIFACEPEWKSLAEEIGGNKVKAFAATHAKQDPHHIRARPSLIAKIRRADLIFCSGAGLEVGWMPILLQKANSKVQPGKLGYLMASNYTPVIDIPDKVDRSHGDVHPEGNPHVHLDPNNILLVAKELNKRLAVIDSINKNYYQENYNNFINRWKKSLLRWEKDIESIKDQRIIIHHKSFDYLFNWMELDEVAALEVKPGIPPTASHLKNILQDINNNPADIIVISPYDPSEGALWLSKQTKIPVVTLPYTIGGNEESINLFALFDSSIKIMQNGLYDKQ
ncbi:zinc ABC transporter substrate-binding protein [Alphaproteobacteria bacterium]|nr:zinc ABC transporter substrate-binding protein [Alphaproteobacteria bacterium]